MLAGMNNVRREFALTNGKVSNEVTQKMSTSMIELVLYKPWLINT